MMTAELENEAPLRTTALYLSDEEIRKRVGIGRAKWAGIVRTLEPDGFPKKDPLIGNKRFWPAVRHFFFRRAGLDGILNGGDSPDDEDWS